jgi:hypothetical protein
MADGDDLRNLLLNPRETLDFELKEWIDPKQPEGKAKIARGCLALRNNDGGRLVIGFTDAGQPATDNVPPHVREVFHNDVVQSIVSGYAADPFTVDVGFVELNGQEYPVITVPSGVRSPVAAKSTLKATDGKELVRDHTVYVRTVRSNNIVSSAEARRGDWERLTTICFNNREADIGGFVRRHLAALDLNSLAELVPAFAGMLHRPSERERAATALNRGRERFASATARDSFTAPAIGFRESAVLVDGDIPAQPAGAAFLDRLLASAPRHTGWPPWILRRNSRPSEGGPNVIDEGWEALMRRLDPGEYLTWPHLDFWRMEPNGFFYHLRGIEDDLAGPSRGGPVPLQQLDFGLQIARTAEVVSTGLSFGRAMGCDPTKTSLLFGFRWTRLSGRVLSSWVEPRRWLSVDYVASQDELVATAAVPLDTPPSSIAPHIEGVVRGLFALFQGFTLDSKVIEGIVAETLQRRV